MRCGAWNSDSMVFSTTCSFLLALLQHSRAPVVAPAAGAPGVPQPPTAAGREKQADHYRQWLCLGFSLVFGDQVVAAAMIDRLVHHAEILGLKGDSYRLKDRDIGRAEPHQA